MSLLSQKAEVLRTMRKNPKRPAIQNSREVHSMEVGMLMADMDAPLFGNFRVPEMRRALKLLGSINGFGYTLEEFVTMVSNLCHKQTFKEE